MPTDKIIKRINFLSLVGRAIHKIILKRFKCNFISKYYNFLAPLTPGGGAHISSYGKR
jgi:hypothetical protein